jgi:hypothetical protein
MVNLDDAKFIGEGEWVKDAAYQVYELDEKFYAVVVVNRFNKEILDEMTMEIKEEEISRYI